MDGVVFRKVKVFSATKIKDREGLGERVTEWINKEKPLIVHKEVNQSSDAEFHCMSIVIFYN